MDGSSADKQRTMPIAGLRRPGANAFIPLLLIKNGQALVKAVPYSILQRAMCRRMQQSKHKADPGKPLTPATPDTPQSADQQASSFPCSNETVSKPHDFGLSITDVKSISMTEYNQTAVKSQGNSPQRDTANRPEQETNLLPEAGSVGSEADPCRKLKMKISRQRSTDPSTTWRVVACNEEPASSEKDHQDDKLRGTLDRSSDNCNSENLTKEHLTRQSNLNPERKWSTHEYEKTCARCEPFSNQTRAASSALCKSPSPSSATHATGPSLTSSLQSVDSSTCQPELESSMQYTVNKRKSKRRPSSPTTTSSTGSLPLVSPRGDHSCTDTTSSSGVPHKRRRLSAASSSGDFHSSAVEARPSHPDTSDTGSDTSSSDLEECPQWIYEKPDSKGAVCSTKTTPVTSKNRRRETPVVLESPRDEMIHNLKRLLAQHTEALDNLKAGSEVDF